MGGEGGGIRTDRRGVYVSIRGGSVVKWVVRAGVVSPSGEGDKKERGTAHFPVKGGDRAGKSFIRQVSS